MTAVQASPDGDDTRIDVRLVLAPVGGVFHPAPVGEVTTDGELVERDGLLGHIAGPGAAVAVTSFCAGFLVCFVAEPGERVRASQPVAWLHPIELPHTHPRPAP